MKVSIIISVYNGTDILPLTLPSMINQDYDKNMNRLDAQKRDNILKKGFRYITEGITNFLNRAESVDVSLLPFINCLLAPVL